LRHCEKKKNEKLVREKESYTRFNKISPKGCGGREPPLCEDGGGEAKERTGTAASMNYIWDIKNTVRTKKGGANGWFCKRGGREKLIYRGHGGE